MDEPLHIFIIYIVCNEQGERRGINMADGVGYAAGFGGGFTLLVVLFILLIIVGASFCGGWY